ncbi:hypothetical protein [Enterobacter asburiae]|uniref:hypothetical protein n=1 Tax=Enterobacter asburiae TaxID=61645 RepID=UPI003F55DCF5
MKTIRELKEDGIELISRYNGGGLNRKQLYSAGVSLYQECTRLTGNPAIADDPDFSDIVDILKVIKGLSE